MHKYLLKLIKYTEEGALTNDVSFISADTPQQLADNKTKYDKMRYTKEDEEGKTIIGNKMYKTEPMQGVYEVIADFDAFCSVNAVLR